MTSYPFWLTPSSLGTYAHNTSFTASPVVLLFSDTQNAPCVVSLLNGELPPGITWSAQGYVVTLTGVIDAPLGTTTWQFTLRASNGSTVADRTFEIVTTRTVSSFTWLTSNLAPLGVVYDDLTYDWRVQAQVVPQQQILYSISNITALSSGISMDASSGTITVDLSWHRNQLYQSTKDYVYNNQTLYECVISGTSTSSVGPVGVGPTVVDSVYAAWEPLRFYTVNSTVTNDQGKIYLCVQAGISDASPGPQTNLPGAIVDGSVAWVYVDQALVWSSVAPGTSLTWSLLTDAVSNSVIISRSFDITVVSTPSDPLWITLPGSLGSYAPGVQLSIPLQAVDPDQQVLTWSSMNLPTWLNLSVLGEVWGMTPMVSMPTSYTFDVTVSDGVSTSTRSFSILVNQTVVTFAWVTQSDLGIMRDGSMSDLVLIAESVLPGALVSYGLVGGVLPLGTSLNMSTGTIQGFVEWHAQHKTYVFEVQASDGVSMITREFSVMVESSGQGIMWNLSIPLLGQDKFEFLSSNSLRVVPDQYLYLPSNLAWGRIQNPQIVIAGGIRNENAETVRQLISNWMHNFRVSLTQLMLHNVNEDYQILSVMVRDSHTHVMWQPLTAYERGVQVTVPSGATLVSVQAGTSGMTAPEPASSLIADGSVLWSSQGAPLQFVSRGYALPWYPQHLYAQGNTVTNQGQLYENIQTGYSQGDLGPQGMGMNIVDGDTRWNNTPQSVPVTTNIYWPSSIRNMRQALVSNLGWSNSWGSLAQAEAVVDTTTGVISSVTVLNAGTGYAQAPRVNIQGTGVGAQLQVWVGVIHVQVISSSLGISVGTQFELDLGEGTPAVLAVSGLNQFAQVASIQVINSGMYQRLPTVSMMVPVGSGMINLTVTGGVVGVEVIQGGSGYDHTTLINFDGREYNPVSYSLQQDYQPTVGLAYVQNPTTWSMTDAQNPYLGQQLMIKFIKAELTGIQWQGMTRFDQNDVNFDAGATRFVEWSTATQTIWDQDLTYWDQQGTTFDALPLTQVPRFSNTVFDDDTTLFDYYATLFDQTPATTQSRWSASWLWFMGKPFDNVP